MVAVLHATVSVPLFIGAMERRFYLFIQVVFMSLCKSFWDCGLVALDDITVQSGSCWSPESLPPPPGQCTFDQDECAFTQEKRNRSSWHRKRGETPTSYTGPKGDHTTGVGE
ncbi:MAM domain-containing protein 2-like [Fukomys damarensis]|uniref:MAM domain-containing protein 2-like n=2 Tax=Fukomys damarensis TaxID=885580 RepID=UPI00053FB87E|nr:MAM domain-containing protein 2-like [Fukomys damarensis]